MKKFFAVVAVAALSLGAVSCGEKKAEEPAVEETDSLEAKTDSLQSEVDTLKGQTESLEQKVENHMEAPTMEEAAPATEGNAHTAEEAPAK